MPFEGIPQNPGSNEEKPADVPISEINLDGVESASNEKDLQKIVEGLSKAEIEEEGAVRPLTPTERQGLRDQLESIGAISNAKDPALEEELRKAGMEIQPGRPENLE